METQTIFTPNLLTSLVTLILLLSTMVEIALEALKPVFSRIVADDLRRSAYILASATIGVTLAFLFNFNLLSLMPALLIPSWAGIVVMGVLSAAGSRFWHSLLELLIKLSALVSAKAEEPPATASVSVKAEVKPTVAPAMLENDAVG